MYYIKYDGEYVLDLVINCWEDECGLIYCDNYLLTGTKNDFAVEFQSREEVDSFINKVSDDVDYLTEDDLEIVEE